MNDLLEFKPRFSEDEVALATFLKTFHEICTSYNKINPQKHLRTILRSKGELAENPKKGQISYVDPIEWDIKKLLKRTKDYYAEMLSSGYQSEEDIYDESVEFEYKRKR